MTDDNQYYVVFYDKYVASVPESWIDTDKHILYLPPKNIPNRKQMARMKVESDWSSEEARKILGPFDYKTSITVEKNCTDISSHEESDAIVEDILSKNLKKRNCPKKVYSESDESDKEVEPLQKRSRIEKSSVDGFISSMKENVQIKVEKNRIPHEIEENQKTDETPVTCIAKNIESDTQEKDKIVNNIDRKISTKNTKEEARPNIINQSLQYNKDDEDSMSDMSDSREIESSQQSLYVLKESNKTNVIDQEASTSGINPKKIKIVSDVPVKLPMKPVYVQSRQSREVSSNNSEILTVPVFQKYYSNIIRKLNLLVSKSTSNANTEINDENSILPSMPIENMEQMEELETLLKGSDAARKEYMTKIQHIGGATEGEYIRNVLREVMCKEVAERYSWSGQARATQVETKKRFKDMKICTILVDVVSKNPKCSKSGCESSIKSFLQHIGEKKSK